MVQHAREKPLSRPADSRSDTLTADARRLRALSRELRRRSEPKREKVQADLAALLAGIAYRRGRTAQQAAEAGIPA